MEELFCKGFLFYFFDDKTQTPPEHSTIPYVYVDTSLLISWKQHEYGLLLCSSKMIFQNNLQPWEFLGVIRPNTH